MDMHKSPWFIGFRRLMPVNVCLGCSGAPWLTVGIAVAAVIGKLSPVGIQLFLSTVATMNGQEKIQNVDLKKPEKATNPF